MTSSNHRQTEFPVDSLFLNRWSPRAFTGEPIPEADLLTILEAARWAPSSANSQPWRFVYALRGSPQWETLFGLLNDYNQSWAKTASALVIVVSKTHYSSAGSSEEKPSRSHSFDTGAAWAMLAMQSVLSGYFAHGMGGVHFDKAMEVLGIPEHGYRVEAAVAIGRLGDKAQLPEGMREREIPSQRVALADIAFNGTFVVG